MNPAKPPSSDSVSPADRVRAVLMLESLTALLDRVRGAREALPHLAALESGLAKGGLAAIGRIAPAWRTRMCAQLSTLPLAEGDAPMQDLLNLMLGAPGSSAAAVAPAPSAAPDDRVEMARTVDVREISHSEFMSVAGTQESQADGNA